MPIYTLKLVAFEELWLLNLQGLVILVHMSFLQLNDIVSVTSGSRLFGLSHFGLGTFQSDYEIMQKSYMFTF